MIKWFRDKANIAKKTAGLEEKKAAMQKKIEVAMSILDQREEERRQEDHPVIFERRKHA